MVVLSNDCPLVVCLYLIFKSLGAGLCWAGRLCWAAVLKLAAEISEIRIAKPKNLFLMISPSCLLLTSTNNVDYPKILVACAAQCFRGPLQSLDYPG
jgi:hypothetical protein